MHYLIIPGLNDSGPEHWQSIWLAQLPNTTKVEQKNWDNPQLTDWLEILTIAINKLNEPTILVAHSLGCIITQYWQSINENDWIIGALLVAPADVESPDHCPAILHHFAPIPICKNNFPTILVASENDPYLDISRAEDLAKCWGSLFINVGEKGHLNTDSDLGEWEYGKSLLNKLSTPLL